MNRSFLLSALFAAALAPPAAAYDLLTQGGFETGSLADWQTFDQGASGGTGSWYAHTSGNGTYSGLPTSPPPVGSWQAVADNNGRAAAILYRDVAIPATTRATLSFRLWLGNASPGGYVNGSSLNPASTNQRVRVDVIDPATGLLVTSSGVHRVVYATTAATPAIVNPTTVTDDLTSLAGQTVRLRIALVGTAGPIIAGIDDVRLDVSPFTLSAEFPGLYTAPARWGDFDGDGRMEVAQAGSDDVNSYCWVWKWTPLFGGGWNYFGILPGLAQGSIAVGDADNDNDLDLGGAGWSVYRQHDLLVERNDGGSGFAHLDQGGVPFAEPGARNGSFDWGDHDFDGDLDALVSGVRFYIFGEYNQTFVAVNSGGGQLAEANPGLPAVVNGQAAWCDVYADGALDVAMAGSGLSSFLFGTSTGSFDAAATGLPALESAAVAVGDLTNDGLDEIVLSGLEAGTPVSRVYTFDVGDGSWSATAAVLPGVHESWLSLGDVDNDGWLDIALCGNTGASRLSRIYRNNGDGSFTDMQAGLPGVSRGSIELGDWEGDGDLDVLLQGTQGGTHLTRIYLNAPPVANAAPGAPGETYTFVGTSLFSVDLAMGGTDDHTPANLLTYNFRIGSSPGATDIVSPMSRLSDGKRLVPRPGEARFGYFRVLPILGVGHGSLYVSAQTVDQSFKGSAWGPEVVHSLGPRIVEVNDVPGDQGGFLRVKIEKSTFDDEFRPSYPAIGYNVWRLIPAGPLAQRIEHQGTALSPEAATARLVREGGGAAASASVAPRDGAAPGASTDMALIDWQGRTFTRSPGVSFANPFPAGTWEIVGSFFALQQANYVVALPTVADSGSSGPNDQSFIVTVHTTTPTVWFASLPVSGHSVDNLAPGAPLGLSAAHHTGSGNQLAWQPAPEPDFEAFRVYRGSTPGFTAGPGNLVATVQTPQWTDPGYDAPTVYYRVSTVDHNGNESPAVAPGQTTGTPVSAAPLEFALRAASPNPFTSSTRIAFALPHETQVKLDVYDAAGRLVRAVTDALLPAGEHAVAWDGNDRSGGRVQAGVYFYRMRAGSFTATRRVALLP